MWNRWFLIKYVVKINLKIERMNDLIVIWRYSLGSDRIGSAGKVRDVVKEERKVG